MGFYGNLAKEETEVIELEIYTECNLLLLEVGAKANLTLDIGRGKTCNILIRNKESASRDGGEINHGPSIKIKRSIIDKKDEPLRIPQKNEKSKFVIDNKNDIKKLERKYRDVMNFVDDNADTLNKLWSCKDKDEFDSLINKLIK